MASGGFQRAASAPSLDGSPHPSTVVPPLPPCQTEAEPLSCTSSCGGGVPTVLKFVKSPEGEAAAPLFSRPTMNNNVRLAMALPQCKIVLLSGPRVRVAGSPSTCMGQVVHNNVMAWVPLYTCDSKGATTHVYFANAGANCIASSATEFNATLAATTTFRLEAGNELAAWDHRSELIFSSTLARALSIGNYSTSEVFVSTISVAEKPGGGRKLQAGTWQVVLNVGLLTTPQVTQAALQAALVKAPLLLKDYLAEEMCGAFSGCKQGWLSVVTCPPSLTLRCHGHLQAQPLPSFTLNLLCCRRQGMRVQHSWRLYRARVQHSHHPVHLQPGRLYFAGWLRLYHGCPRLLAN